MAAMQSRYIPALSFGWLTPFYDPLLKWGMREQTFKERLIRRANVKPGERVLDLACGTGTLTVMLQQAAPEARVTGLDGDPEILSIARMKAARQALAIEWDLGMAYDLPYPDRSFDVVVSSLAIHHLVTGDKLSAFREVLRILRPGAAFHILDFGRPFSSFTHVQAAIMKSWEHVRDNFGGRLVPLLGEAGFAHASEAEPMNTIFGPIWFYSAVK